MFKELLLEEIITFYKKINNYSGPIKIMEMGSGTSSAINYILDKGGIDIEYVGIEPSNTIEIARKNIGTRKNVTLRKEFGYKVGIQESFDIVVSLSVLEHVKDLPAFIKTSSQFVKKGGIVVHLYDLGHSLYPSSLKEKFQVFLGNHFPFLLSQLKFVRYVPLSEVSALCEKNGLRVTNVSYHQMPSHKLYANLMQKKGGISTEVSKSIFTFEADLSKRLENDIQKEYLFPSVCLWSAKD